MATKQATKQALRQVKGPSASARAEAAWVEPEGGEARNEVLLWGRVSAAAEQRELPSGDLIVTMRVVVKRPEPPRRARSLPEGRARPPGVDTIDVVCWSASARRSALRLAADDRVEVVGALRRRFFGGAAGRQSRYEVEATAVRRRVAGRRVGA